MATRNDLERAHAECVDKYGHGATTQALLAATNGAADWTDAVPDDKIARAVAALKAVRSRINVTAKASKQKSATARLNEMASAIYSRHGQHR